MCYLAEDEARPTPSTCDRRLDSRLATLACTSTRMEQERVMSAQRHILAAVISISVGLPSFAEAAYASTSAARYASSPSHKSGQVACRCTPLPGPGLQRDYQFYYDTPGYFPGFYPGAGYAPEFGPPLRAGFSEGPLGVH